MQSEDMERTVTMLPRSVVEKLDKAAVEQGMSRSGLVRTLVMTYLRQQEKPD